MICTSCRLWVSHCYSVQSIRRLCPVVQLWFVVASLYEFEMLELDEVMPQRGGSAFAELLCRVRTGQSVVKFTTSLAGSRK